MTKSNLGQAATEYQITSDIGEFNDDHARILLFYICYAEAF
ncbi:hypothetical protein [Nostoc sp.]|nr:hypothetical protein [Nostoc sp. S13]